MNLKQWKTIEKCRKLGNAGGFCFVRDNYLYAGNNYAAVRLHNADTLTGAAFGVNASIRVDSFPNKTSEPVTIVYGDRMENLRSIDRNFEIKGDGVSHAVDPDYLKPMLDVANAFNWYVQITGVEVGTYGVFVGRKKNTLCPIQGDFVIMGVRLA